MEEHKLLNAERSDFFLKPIPRWVTLYGFVILTVLVTLVVVLSLFFKVPHIIHLKVYVTKDSIFAISNFAQLEEIKNIKKIEIQLPTINRTTIKGYLDFKNILIDKKNIMIPINVKEEDVPSLSVKGGIICSGEITAQESSLFSKILTKSKTE